MPWLELSKFCDMDNSLPSMKMTEKVLKALKALENLENLQLLQYKEINQKRKRRYWVNPHLIRYTEFDLEANLLKDLLWEEKEYANFCRMSIGKFEEVLSMIKSGIEKKDTNMRYSIKPRIRLAITLRFIASGDSYRSLEFFTRISRRTISRFIPEVLSAIYAALQPHYLKIPEKRSEWLEVARDFQYIWHFPHTLGALDGKHIRILAPAHSGSTFYNYKGFFSIVLFALVDAHSAFLYINVGANGKASDSSIFQRSYLARAMANNTLNIPNAETLSETSGNIPFYFIGDDAFSLDEHIMKPYSRSINLSPQQEIFNYRICRARMTVEMAFGRLANRFRIFHRPIEVAPETTDMIVKTCCVLHNFLIKKRIVPTSTDAITTEELPSNFIPINPQQYTGYKFANRIRDKISLYCITEGNVSFQWNKISNK